jgi:hypothetical protein
MASSSWSAGVSGDWNTATNWTPAGVPNGAAADVIIDAVPAAGTNNYSVVIAAGESETVNSLMLNGANNALNVNQSPYKGAVLAVNGTLTFAPGSAGALGGPLQNFVQMTSGRIVNAGTVDAFVQTGGNVVFSGTNPIYFTNALQSQGVTTIDTSRIGEYDPLNKSLLDGIFEAQGPGTSVNFGGSGGGLAPVITTIYGPKAVPTQDFWTQLIFVGPGSSINEWNGSAYVPVESTLTSIGTSGVITVIGGRNYLTTNPFTIGANGLFEQTAGVFSTGGLTIAPLGILSSGLTAQHDHTTTAGTDPGMLTVGGTVTNNGNIQAYGGGIVIAGPLTGQGTLTYNPAGASTLELAGSVGPGEIVSMNGGDALVLDAAGAYQGGIAFSGTGNNIYLRNADGQTAAITGNTLQIKAGANVIKSIPLAGDSSGTTVTVLNTGLSITDATTGSAVAPASQVYTGPAGGIGSQYINVTPDSLNIAASTPSWFIHSGAGNDSIAASSGTNVLDGGAGANILSGGSGLDTFLVDAGSSTAATWSILANFHAGDFATLVGTNSAAYAYGYQDHQGPPGGPPSLTGLTVQLSAAGKAATSMTIVGYSMADLATGRLTTSVAPDGSTVTFHANG